MTVETKLAQSGLDEVVGAIEGAKRLAIIAHVNPDADAIGSVVGMSLGLRAIGKAAYPALNDPVPEYAKFLTGAEEIGSNLPTAAIDLVVMLDAAERDRVGEIFTAHSDQLRTVPIVNIDHHRTNPLFGSVNYVVAGASSTSELVYHVLQRLGAPIDADIASALLFGIMGDTGAFQNGATTPSALAIASELVGSGGDSQRVAFHLFERKTFAAARLWGHVISGIELDRRRGIVFAFMSQQMLIQEGATVDEAEGIGEYLRGVVEAEVVMLLKENEDGEMRVSMRSRPSVDVAAIASALGGGGHRQAAGCTLPGPFADARDRLLSTFDSLAASA